MKNFVTDESYERGVVITTAMFANAIPVAEVTFSLVVLANKDWFATARAISEQGRDAFPACRKVPHAGNCASTVGLISSVRSAVCTRPATQPGTGGHRQRPVPHSRCRCRGRCRSGRAGRARATQRRRLLHAPKVPETEGMLDATFFQAMKDGASFINTARGSLVVEEALVAELETGRIQAFLDVTHPEPPEAGHFYRLPNCLLTPHRAGSSTVGEYRRMGRFAIDDAIAIIEGREPYRLAADAGHDGAAAKAESSGGARTKPARSKGGQCRLPSFELLSGYSVRLQLHEQAQDVEEQEREAGEQFERGAYVAVFRIAVDDVRGVVEDGATGEADHGDREPTPSSKPKSSEPTIATKARMPIHIGMPRRKLKSLRVMKTIALRPVKPRSVMMPALGMPAERPARPSTGAARR